MNSVLRFPMMKLFNFGLNLKFKVEMNGLNYKILAGKAGRASLFNEFEGNRIIWSNKVKNLEYKLKNEINEKKSLIIFFSGLLAERGSIISNLNLLVGEKDNEIEELKNNMDLEKEELKDALECRDMKISEMEAQSTEQSNIRELLEGNLEEAMTRVRNLTFHLNTVKHEFQKYVEGVETRNKSIEEILEIESDLDISEDEMREKNSEESENERIDYGTNLNPGQEIEYLKQKISNLHRLNWRLAKSALLLKQSESQSTSLPFNSDYPRSESCKPFYHDDAYQVNSHSVPLVYTSQSEFTHPQLDLPEDENFQNISRLNSFSSDFDLFSSESQNLYQDQNQILSPDQIQLRHRNQIQFCFQDQVQIWNWEQDREQYQDQTHFDYQNQVKVTNILNENYLSSSQSSTFSDKSWNTDFNSVACKLSANTKAEFEYEFFEFENSMTVENASHSLPSENRNSAQAESRFEKLFSQIYDNDASSLIPPMNHCHENKNKENNDNFLPPIILF